ncbi:hypothetical protein V6N13_142102 [Hibiscus sabdariffa]
MLDGSRVSTRIVEDVESSGKDGNDVVVVDINFPNHVRDKLESSVEEYCGMGIDANSGIANGVVSSTSCKGTNSIVCLDEESSDATSNGGINIDKKVGVVSTRTERTQASENGLQFVILETVIEGSTMASHSGRMNGNEVNGQGVVKATVGDMSISVVPLDANQPIHIWPSVVFTKKGKHEAVNIVEDGSTTETSFIVADL